MKLPDNLKKGQAIVGAIIVSSIVTSAATWFANHFLDAPEAQGAEINELNTKVKLLCNDYGQTVSRMDQNLQNIGNALKVPIVVGNANSDPCNTKK